MPGGHRLLDPVLDDRLVDERQHLLGLRLGGGQEARAEAGGGEDGLADLRHGSNDATTGPLDRPVDGACYPRGPEEGHARPEVRRREPRARARDAGERAARPSSRSRPAGPRGVDPGRSTRARRCIQRGRGSCGTASAWRARRSRGAAGPSEDASALKAEMKGVADEIKALEAQLDEVEGATRAPSCWSCPTCPTRACPSGTDAADNVEVRRVGEPPRFDFAPKAALGPRARARHPRLRARRQDLRRALRRLLGRRRAAGARAHQLHARPAHARARLPRGASRPSSSPRRR